MVNVVDKKLYIFCFTQGVQIEAVETIFFFSFNFLVDKNAFISYSSNLVLAAELNSLKTLILFLTYIKPPK